LDYPLRESTDSNDGADDRQSGCMPPTRADDILGKRKSGVAVLVEAPTGSRPCNGSRLIE